VLAMAREARRLTGTTNLCLAGGVALNCVANGRLLRSGIFEKLWIQPAAGDAGGALGAALAAWHIGLGRSRHTDGVSDRMQGAYLGPEYTEREVESAVLRYAPVYQRCESFEQVCDLTAGYLDEGAIVGWFQGRMEWGVRVLGIRSILADYRNPEIQRKLNLKIKKREGFRPFAPSVLVEELTTFFELAAPSPYMMLVADLVQEHRKPLPEGYQLLGVMDKLYHVRSDIPAVTHIDYSARLQTVHRETNPRYWGLIDRFKERTGYGVLVNTSFNERGEPIVLTPEDAFRCFMRTDMDYLVMGNCIFDKKAQSNLVCEAVGSGEGFVPD